MKIVLVNKTLNNTGGQEIIVENLIKCFYKKHTITILSKDVNQKVKKRYPEVKFLKKIEDANSFDLFHFHNPFHLFTLIKILQIRHNKKICTFHSKMFSPNFLKKIILSFYTTTIIKILPFFIDKFIYLSLVDKIIFEKKMFAKRPSSIIENTIEKEFFQNKIKTPSNKVLFVGRLKKSKGFYDIIEVAKKMPDVNFSIVGTGKIKKITTKNVRILGLKSRKEMIDLHRKSSLFLLPSYSECFPLTIIEAMASGTPIACSDIKELKYIVKNNVNGKIFNLGDILKIKEAINSLLNNDKLYKKISGNNLKESKKKYSPEIFKNKHLKIYEEK